MECCCYRLISPKPFVGMSVVVVAQKPNIVDLKEKNGKTLENSQVTLGFSSICHGCGCTYSIY